MRCWWSTASCRRSGPEARELDGPSAETVDLDGGFLMPSFGDGHAHPMLGGLEAVGPQVRPCKSVDEIVAAVRTFAAEHPDEEWIVGASYDSSLAPDGLFDARWLDAAVARSTRGAARLGLPHRVVQLRGTASGRASPPTRPTRRSARFRAATDGSVLGTLREWGAVDLVASHARTRPPRCCIGALGTAADYYLARGVTWVQDAWVEPADVDTYLDAARRGALGVRFNLGAVRRSAAFRPPSSRSSPTPVAASRSSARRC